MEQNLEKKRIKDEIRRLKAEQDAIILAHYYVEDDIQEIADFVGDSFALAKKAESITQKTIVFCGVLFMGESAKIINPDKKVIVPELSADCPMAHMITPERIEAFRKEHPGVAVVCYVNSTAEIKAVSDVCVTSSNAVNIVKKLENKEIFFVPDKHLGHFVAEQVPEKKVFVNEGFCPVHDSMKLEELLEQKVKHPEALVVIHPECSKELIEQADYAGSTKGILDFVKNSNTKEFIVLTEVGILYELRKNNPDKTFYFTKTLPVCQDMKKITLEKVLISLQKLEPEIIISEELARQASTSLKRMLELTKE